MSSFQYSPSIPCDPGWPGAHFPQRPRPSPQHRPGQRILGSHLKARGSPTRGTWRWARGAHATPARNAGSSPWPRTSARISAHLAGPSTSGHIRPDVAVPSTGRDSRGWLRDRGSAASAVGRERRRPPTLCLSCRTPPGSRGSAGVSGLRLSPAPWCPGA